MSYVWEHSLLGGTELLCLLAIADFADDKGAAYPSIKTIARKIRMSERNAHYLIAKLAKCGELEIERGAGPYGCNLFRVQTLQVGAKFAGVQSLQGCNPLQGGGATGSARGVQPIAPEPSLEPSIEPSYSSKPRTKRKKRRSSFEQVIGEGELIATIPSLKGDVEIRRGFVMELIDAYPDVLVAQEIDRAKLWLAANPTKLKAEVRRFLTSWVARTQEKGGSR